MAGAALSRSRLVTRRWLATEAKAEATTSTAATAAKELPQAQAKKGWWHSAELWGGLGALAGWGMSGK